METFMLKEYLNNKLAIQREYFLDLKESSSNKIVLINGKKYERTDISSEKIENILFLPKENLRTLPIIQWFSNNNFITLEINKIVNKNFLERKLYSLEYNENTKEIKAILKVQYYDIRDEIDNKNYLEDYFIERSIKGETSKKLIYEYVISAVRDFEKTIYTVSLDGDKLFTQLDENNLSLFELLNDLSKQLTEKNNLKK